MRRNGNLIKFFCELVKYTTVIEKKSTFDSGRTNYVHRHLLYYQICKTLLRLNKTISKPNQTTRVGLPVKILKTSCKKGALVCLDWVAQRSSARFTILGSQFQIQTRPDKFCLEKKHLSQSSLVIFVILL